MLLNVANSQLVLIDYQPRLMSVVHDAQSSFERAMQLTTAANLLNVPVIGTEQNPTRLGETAEKLRKQYNEVLIKKNFSAVPDGLTEILLPTDEALSGNARSLPKHIVEAKKKKAQQQRRDSIVIAGWETHICVLQTAVELLEQDVDVWVVSDACGSRTDINRDAAFDRMASLGIELVTTEMVLFEWLRSYKHPEFKTIQKLIK